MKPIRIAWCLTTVALVLGCEQTTEPAVQADELTEAAFKVEHETLVREFTWDEPSFVTCANDGAGEYLLWNGIVVATTKKVTNPSGMHSRSTKIDEFKGLDFDHFQATGLDSGDVWIINPNGSTWTARRNTEGDMWNWHQVYSFKFTNQYGERLHMQGTRVEKYDKNGEIVNVEYNRGSCPDVWE